MLSDLSTYSLRDFLLFDAAIYRDLFGQLNADLWPLPLAATALALLLLGLRVTRPNLADAGAALLLAGACLASAWFFFFGVYGTINFAATYPGRAFLFETGLFLLAALLTAIGSARSQAPHAPSRLAAWVASAVILYGLFGHPAVELAAGRAADNLEWFALAPDPTALVALGFLAFWRSPWRYALAVVPVVWLAVSAMTLYGLSIETEALCLALGGLAGLIALLLPRPRASDSGSITQNEAQSLWPLRSVDGNRSRFPGRKAIGGQALLPTTRRQ